jgi:hypothetical protein
MNLRLIATIAVLLWTTARSSLAEEKSWEPRHAQLIVTGKLSPMYAVPWFDGWHVWGTLQVHEVLKGAADGNRLRYRYFCPVCRFWPIPQWELYTHEGIWHLDPLDRETWKPVFGTQSLTGGYRRLEDLEYTRKLLDRNKTK